MSDPAPLRSDVAVSITGIAGPDGGTREKPVGLVYIAVSVKGAMRVEEYHFTGNRMKIRESAVVAALTLLRTNTSEAPCTLTRRPVKSPPVQDSTVVSVRSCSFKSRKGHFPLPQ